MTKPNPILDSLRVKYSGAIPPHPRRNDSAPRNILFNFALADAAQDAANLPANGYHGDLSALTRHAVHLWLLVLAESSGQDVSQLRFNMEILRQKAEEADYLAFVNYVQVALQDAEGYGSTVAGRKSAVELLRGAVNTTKKHPSRVVRLRMEAHLTGDSQFVKMVEEVGDRWLKSWLEVAT